MRRKSSLSACCLFDPSPMVMQVLLETEKTFRPFDNFSSCLMQKCHLEDDFRSALLPMKCCRGLVFRGAVGASAPMLFQIVVAIALYVCLCKFSLSTSLFQPSGLFVIVIYVRPALILSTHVFNS